LSTSRAQRTTDPGALGSRGTFVDARGCLSTNLLYGYVY
jgi:hypothetical protein